MPCGGADREEARTDAQPDCGATACEATADTPSAPRVPGRTVGATREEACSRDPQNAEGDGLDDNVKVAVASPEFRVPGIHNRMRRTEQLGQRVRRGSKSIDKEVTKICSFEGCEDLLRGSHISVILRDQARILSNSSGSAATYSLSKATRKLDAFISHNWCVSRWHKWACLLLHFNAKMALFMTFLAALPFGVLAVHGWVPTVHPEFAPYPRSYLFKLLLYPVALFNLCFCRNIARFFRVGDPLVFLDKTCIHQEDKAIQRRGIERLGAFLCYSNTMVICYSDVYLKKLWTVYEVACFMTLQSVEQMRVIPVMFPAVCLLSLSFLYTAGVLSLWPELTFGFYYTGQISCLLCSYMAMLLFRLWGRSKIDMYKTMSTFSTRNCVCFCEGDRPLVHANIAALMRATQDIGQDASEDEALERFDYLVRNHLAGALISSVGKYAVRYEHAVGVGYGFLTVVMDQLVGIAHGMPWRAFFNYALWYAFTAGVVVPSLFMGFATWADLRLRITGWQEKVYLAIGVLIVYAPVVLGHQVLDMLETWANDSDVGIVVFVLAFVVSATLVRNAMNASPRARTFCSGHAERHEAAAMKVLRGEFPSNVGELDAPVPGEFDAQVPCELDAPVPPMLMSPPLSPMLAPSPLPPVWEPIEIPEVKKHQDSQAAVAEVHMHRKLHLGTGWATVEYVSSTFGDVDDVCHDPTHKNNECESFAADYDCVLGCSTEFAVRGQS